MRKIFFILLAVFALAACDKDTARHAINVTYPNGYGVVYADQKVDTIVFSTFDSYRATANASWIIIDPQWASSTIQNSYWNLWQGQLPLSFDANTTGNSRSAIVSINNYGDDWDETVSASYVQLGWLDVTRPQPVLESYSDYPLTATFELADSATQVTDTLEFTVYGDWTLTSNASFVTPEVTSGTKGENKVALKVTENTTASERNATITLGSSGVETSIVLKQEAKKEE